MNDHGQGAVLWDAAAADARRAALEFDNAQSWLEQARRARSVPPLAAEVWVIDPGFGHVLLVEHRVRGWVPPGGTVETDETPRQAAARELQEETGLRLELLDAPAAVAVRSYQADWSPTLGLSYAAIADRQAPLGGEEGQPPAWLNLDDHWQSVFPDDRDRIRAYVQQLAHRE